MKTNTILGLFVAMLAIVAFVPSVSAFADLDDVQVKSTYHYVNGVSQGAQTGVFAGEVIPVWVSFSGLEQAEDVRLVARILGEPGFSEVSERFDVLNASTYSRLINVRLPYDLNEELSDTFILEISVENRGENAFTVPVTLVVQRTSYELEVLAVEADDRVHAGDNLAIDVVVKNRGFHEAQDTFIRASVPELGISKMLFLGDLANTDENANREDKYDSEAGRIFLTIPRDVPAGVYTLEVEAFTDDSTTVVTRRVVVLGASEESTVVTSTTTKSFGANEAMTYTLTVVNAGDSIKVYDLIAESVSGLAVDFEESVVAVPAGSSRTVSMTVTAEQAGTYDFTVNVHSDGELVKTQSYKANVSGRGAVAGDSAVLLTVVLAIIFVVLLIVLIVLLTRKPQKTEELGESYY